jgi:hypothetical protein
MGVDQEGVDQREIEARLIGIDLARLGGRRGQRGRGREGKVVSGHDRLRNACGWKRNSRMNGIANCGYRRAQPRGRIPKRAVSLFVVARSISGRSWREK